MNSPLSPTKAGEGRDVVLSTKLAPPKSGNSKTIERNRLSEKRELVWEVACVNVVAPAGFGKTTLLAQWYAHAKDEGRAAAWLTCDEADQDVYRFSRHLFRALSLASPELEEAFSGIAKSGFDIDIESVGVTIVNALEGLQQPVLLVIDDMHVAASDETNALVGFLVNSGCGYLHIAINSRQQLEFSMGKLRALGQVLDIRTTDLEFAPEEAREAIATILPDDPGPEAIETIVARTEGWATGIRLATMALAAKPDMPLGHLLSGREPTLKAYLREEIIASLPEALGEFVGDTALLGEFSAEFADHIRGKRDSAELIAQLEEKQFFILPLEEPGWYRYHALFVEAFTEGLHTFSPRKKSALHLKAADWLESKGGIERALFHANASESLDDLVELLARTAEEIAHTGRGATLLRYARMIPAEMLQDYPALQLDRVYAATLTWQFSEAKRVLDDVRATMLDTDRLKAWKARNIDIARLERKLIHREMQLLLLQDRMPKVAKLARQWQDMEGGCTPFEDAVARTTLIYAQRELFDFSNVAASKSARETFEAENNRWATVWHDCIIGATHTQMGDLARAQSIFESAFETASNLVGRINPTTAMPALYLADLKYERNDLESATALIDEFLPLAMRTGLVDQLVAGFQTKARIASLSGTDLALRVLEEGEEIAGARQFDRLKAFLLADRIRIFTSAGDTASVRRIGMLNNISSDLEELKPRRNMTSVDAATAYAAAHVAIIENDLSGAESLLARWLQFLEAHQCVRYALKMALALAHAQIVMGEAKAAHRSLRTAMQLGGSGGFIRSFVDANPAVLSVLEDMTFDQHFDLADHHQTILTAMGSDRATTPAAKKDLEETGGQFEALNNRESEILLMISTGMMNKEIAEDLGLTLGTVKWYLQQIYGKMGVNRRSEAVFKARQLGLIA
ncbi:AAA family ATPase [Parasphingopyxis algicola]|uniref:LuxR C-terminal-related transcriptional regulator n=1 Tax=Parasphingopyxis algicola TaxID=2026624 RepID=UPI0015A2CBA8|nr:LuxR C-terminal-related transcriptional regulator [Parasphingopyxis algicola]QLC26501.1 AAA family ATPase [Parasphingopyxis algicola]